MLPPLSIPGFPMRMRIKFLTSTAMFGVSLALGGAILLTPPSSGPAYSAGGSAGGPIANPGGADSGTGAGGVGSNVNGGGGSGGGAGVTGGAGASGAAGGTAGGAGGASAGASGADGQISHSAVPSGGGGGGAHGATSLPTSATTGGNGGQGGHNTADRDAGGGGAGGWGAAITAGGTLTSAVTGGNGGAGGVAHGGGYRGGGGSGGVGLGFVTGNTNATINAAVTGGNGGAAGAGTGIAGAAGAGGTGIAGSGLGLTLGATVSGGLSGNGTTRALALDFTGGTNTLELATGWGLVGGINVVGSLALSSSTNETLANAISGTGSLTKTGASTLILTGTNTYTGGTTISAGTLQIGNGGATGSITGDITNNASLAFSRNGINYNGAISGTGSVTIDASANLTGTNTYSGGTNINSFLSVNSDAALGASTGGLTFDNGFLTTTTSFASARAITLNSGGGTFEPAVATTLTLTGVISGTGALTINGAGTLVLSGVNTYTGDTVLGNGTTRIAADSAFGSAAGWLFINGGALQTTADITMNRRTALQNLGGSFRPDTGTTLTMTNVVDGSWGLTMDGAGKLVLAAANTYTTTTISSGTLQIGNGGTTGSLGTGAVANSGSLVFDRSNSMTVSNAISGTGSITQAGTGTTILTGTNTHTGGTTISAGTLQIGNGGAAGSITGNITNNASLVFDRSNSMTVASTISGTGTLTKYGEGRLNLTGTNTYTGATTVSAGDLAVNGSITSVVTVESGATLSGTGTVGGINALSGSFVGPGNSIGILNVAGNVVFGPGSTFVVEADHNGTSDRINATGTGILNGKVHVLAGAGTYVPAVTYTILNALGGVTCICTDVTTDLAFLTPSLTHDANNVMLTLAKKADPALFASVAQTPNQRAAAGAAEALGGGNPVHDAVLGQSAASARQAFDALSGEAHASTVTSAYQDLLRVQDTILSRLSGGHVSGTDAQPGARSVSLWGTGLGAWSKSRGDGNAAGMQGTTAGFIGGADTQLDPTYRFGIAGGHTSTNVSVNERLSSSRNESTFVSLYGAAQWQVMNLRAGALYAHHDIHVNRSIKFPGFDSRASASYGGSTVMAFGELGKSFDVGGTQLEPFIGASFMRLHMGAFSETGGVAVLTAGSKNYDLGTGTLGLRAETKLDTSMPLTFRGMAGLRHAYGDVTPGVAMAFAGSASTFDVAGIPIDRNTFVAEAGLDWLMQKNVTLGLTYAGQLGERAQSHTMKGSFNWRF